MGRNAVYGREHLERLEEIGRLKAKGLTLHEIGIEPREARDDDQPGQPPRTKIVPVGVPEGVEFDAYFNAKAVRHSAPHKVCYSMREAKVTAYSPPGDYEDYKLFDQPDVQSTHVQDILDRLVARIETDGGMPGADKRERLANTLVALRLLQTAARRQYKRYERRLLDFIMHCEIGLLPHFATRIEEGLDRIDAQLAITGNIRPRSDAWKDAATELLDGKLDTDRILEALQT